MGDADTANIQKLIKKVIEATRCSPAQAELALYDNDNNIFAAVEYILDKGDEDMASWTEHKSKKDKKKEEEERKISSSHRGPSSRGRGGAGGERGGRGAGRGASASTSRGGGAPRGGGGGARGGRGASSRPQGRFQPDSGVLKSVDLNEDASEWKGGSMEFKRSEQTATAVPSSSSATSTVASTAPSNPPSSTISFAAVAAAGARKQQKQQPPVAAAPPPQAEPPRPVTPEPTPVESVSSDEFSHEPSTHLDDPVVPVNQDEPVNVSSVHNVQAASPQLQANVTWTTQLKSDLGIGVPPISADVSPVKGQNQYQTANTLPGVEFVTEAAPTGLVDYHFGFVEAAAPVAQAPPVEAVPQPTESLMFSNARHSAAAVAPLKTEMHLGNGEYPVRNNSPPVTTLPQSRLGFGEASTISYSPVTSAGVDARNQNVPKPLGHMATASAAAHQQQQPQQQHQQQPQQQAMFPSQMPFSYGNPYMYSPVTTGIRPEDYTAALLQYPFTMPGMDMANLMGGGGFPQSSSSQSLTNQHRSDSHGGMENTIKFSSQTNPREQSQQQPAAVQPPPGFGSPFGMQPQMNMLQQHYNPQQYPAAHFMMPNIGTAGGRQMYSSAADDERKSYDKMSGVKSQPSQQAPYHNGNHYGGGMGNNKKYNWNS